MIQRTTASDWAARHADAIRQATKAAWAFQDALYRMAAKLTRAGSDRTKRLRKKRQKAIERLLED